jgi:hypothetical protein
MADDTDQANQSDQHLLPRQFTTVFEYLINVSGFELGRLVRPGHTGQLGLEDAMPS